MKTSWKLEYTILPDTEPGRQEPGAATVKTNHKSGDLSVMPPVIITKFLLAEMANIKLSFQNQVRNVVALHSWLTKRSDFDAAVPLTKFWTVNQRGGQGLSFKLPGSPEAFQLFGNTLFRKSYVLQQRGSLHTDTNILKINLAVLELTALDQELSIVLENIQPTDYVATVLQQRIRYARIQKMAG